MSRDISPSPHDSPRYTPKGEVRRCAMLIDLQRSMRRRRQRRLAVGWVAGIALPCAVLLAGFAVLQGRSPSPANPATSVAVHERVAPPAPHVEAASHVTIVPAGTIAPHSIVAIAHGGGEHGLGARVLNDDELLRTLAQSGRDCGLIRADGRAVVTDNRDGRPIGDPAAEPGAGVAPTEADSRAI